MNNLQLLSIFLVIVAVIFVISRNAGRKNRVTITDPRFGILDLTRGAARALIEQDKVACGDILGTPQESTSTAPVCDVLFVYGELDAQGAFENETRGLREIIRESGARVVVVALENAGERYIKAAPKKPYGHANLVMTLARRGERFPDFFRNLFSLMKKGMPMPLAWVKLAPQIPNEDHPNSPEAIFSCEAGQIIFK